MTTLTDPGPDTLRTRAARARAAAGRARRFSQQSFVRNSIMLMANYVISGMLGFAFWAVAARMLPAGTVGSVAALLAGLGFAAAAAGVGLPNTVVRYLHSEGDQRSFVLAAVGTVLATSTLIALAIVLVPGHLGLPLPDGGSGTVRLLVVALVVATAVGPVVDAVIIGFRITGSIVVKNAVAGSLRIALLPFLAAGGEQGLMWALLVSTALAAAVSFTVGVRRAGVSGTPASGSVWSSLAGKITFSSGNYLAMLVSIAPLAYTPIFALTVLGPAAGAYVTSALLLITALNAIPTTISQSLFAELSALARGAGRAARRAFVLRALRGTYALVAPAVLVVFVTADWVLGIFGPEYTAAAWCLRLMALGSLLGAFNYVADVVINASGRIVAFTVVNTVGSGAVLAGTTIGGFHGLTGLGLGWLVGQGCYSLLAGAALLLSPAPPVPAEPETEEAA